MIIVLKQDITKINVDCIVNAANETLLGGGGVDGAIHRAAGPELLQECKKLNGCKEGEVKLTKGYKLPCKYIIHTVGPVYGITPNQENVLRKCYQNSLNLAKVIGAKTIAFPSISTGVYGYPKEEATKIATQTIKKWLKNDCNDIKVFICCFDNETYNLYNKCLESCGRIS